MNIKTLLLLTLIVLTSCKQPMVSFEEPQPKDTKELKAFPKKIMGSYYNPENNTEITISNHLILKKITLSDTLKITDINEPESIQNDTVYNSISKQKYRINRINDTLFSNYIYVDTLFNISNKNILKKYKGYFFLNKLLEDSWKVEKLSVSNGVLKINHIETKAEIDLLQSITHTTDTTQPFKVKPTRKQFKEFIQKNGFTNGQVYLKK